MTNKNKRYFINKDIVAKLPKPLNSRKRHSSIFWSLPNRKTPIFASTKSESDTIKIFKQECNSYEELLSKLVYAPTEKLIVEFYRQSGLGYEDFNVR